ncbi:RNA polymerase subunit sigma-70 [Spongiactinospora rosea]|uniref:RNA polymerase subunit sigma-70 n=1 Tax=Spongiactinospora rosea TaxID=2248750 RepID=A0A366LV94_9ACTN|nr:RNA polymerase sigma factor SigJ [Spongiactinospora rosea]RBQ17866.1 RNA polymerase subunit sigma-70 [Spongiactinospora rosea]
MDGREFVAERFEEHRARLKAVAYRMLGSPAEAEDAVQEAWLRLARSDAGEIDNLGGWLTTVVGRVCLDMLRSRRQRREEPLGEGLPDPVVSGVEGADPEARALIADAVGPALLVVLESLTPAERLAFVLHDMFGMTFDEVAPVIDRTPVAARQLASRARRRVRGTTGVPDPDPVAQRRVVDAFLAASRGGDFEALLSILDPDVVLRVDGGAGMPGGLQIVRGRSAVADRATAFRRRAGAVVSTPALVNGVAGLVNALDGEIVSIMSFTVVGGRIAEIEILSDRDRLAGLDLNGLQPPSGN